MANHLTIIGLAMVGVAMTGATILVTDVLFGLVAAIAAGATAAGAGVALWALLPLARRRALTRTRDVEHPRVSTRSSVLG